MLALLDFIFGTDGSKQRPLGKIEFSHLWAGNKNTYLVIVLLLLLVVYVSPSKQVFVPFFDLNHLDCSAF